MFFFSRCRCSPGSLVVVVNLAAASFCCLSLHFYFPSPLDEPRSQVPSLPPPSRYRHILHFIAQRVHSAFPLLVDFHRLVLTRAFRDMRKRHVNVPSMFSRIDWDSSPGLHTVTIAVFRGQPLDRRGDRLQRTVGL